LFCGLVFSFLYGWGFFSLFFHACCFVAFIFSYLKYS
jgi:hypothetical protein